MISHIFLKKIAIIGQISFINIEFKENDKKITKISEFKNPVSRFVGAVYHTRIFSISKVIEFV